jgi:L-amino acid N-acyltransferase YncA
MELATIRLASVHDAAAIGAIYGPFCEETAVSFETVAPTSEEIAERINRTTTWFPWLVLDHDSVIAGYAYASRHRDRTAYQWAVDVTVYVSDGYRRRGVGRALYTTLFVLLRELGYFNAYAGIALPNPGSVALHEVLGFTRIGVYRGVGYKLGRWRDVAWYELGLQPRRSDPHAPRSVREIVNGVQWHEAIAHGMQQLKGRAGT